MIQIRPAREEDCPEILRLVKELATFEQLSDQVRATEEDFRRDGFGPFPRFECLLAESGEESRDAAKAVAFALFFHNYSTFEGCAGLYLEDIYVSESVRGQGVGRKLLAQLAATARQRGCRRLDLSVLHWNPARNFYQRLGFEQQNQWLPYRLEGDSLATLAETAGKTS